VPLKKKEWDANINHITQEIMNNLLSLVFKVWSPATHCRNKAKTSKHVRSITTCNLQRARFKSHTFM